MNTVLIIEDDESLYKMYSTELELSSYKVYWQNKGSGVPERAKEVKPDIILCDIIIPEKDGLSVLQDLKSDPDTKNIPVIMLTNFGSNENITKALEGGAEDFLLKYKIVPSEVVLKIKQVLEAK